MKPGKKNSEKKKESIREQAINYRETEGEKINPQEEQRQQQHQPRDKA